MKLPLSCSRGHAYNLLRITTTDKVKIEESFIRAVKDSNTLQVALYLSKYPYLVDLIWQLDVKNKVFLIAVAKGNIEIVEMFINAGADVNYKNLNDHTPLHTAVAKSNRTELVKLLLQHGAHESVHIINKPGNTPFTYSLAVLDDTTWVLLEECQIDPRVGRLIDDNDDSVSVLEYARDMRNNASPQDYKLWQKIVDTLEQNLEKFEQEESNSIEK